MYELNKLNTLDPRLLTLIANSEATILPDTSFEAQSMDCAILGSQNNAAWDFRRDIITINNQLKLTHFILTNAVCHELIHWTGHRTRLNRPVIFKASTSMGTHILSHEEVSLEESTAQYGAMLLMNQWGLYTEEVGEATFQYLKYFKADPEIYKPMAQKAVDYLNSLTYTEQVNTERKAA